VSTHRRASRTGRWAVFALMAIALHVSILETTIFVAPFFPRQPVHPKPRQVSLVILPPEAKKPAPEEEEPKKPDLTGQIVETPPPEVEKTPEKADYLAEHDQTVDEETRTERFKVNPEVLSPIYSEKTKAQVKGEQVEDLKMDKPSTGATVGNNRFDPDRDGSLAALPSPWAKSNKPGIADPVQSSAAESMLEGAPQNDRLDEKVGPQLALNTKEYLYAGYLKRIRRLVNFYWSQNLDNLSSSVRLTHTQYDTTVNVILNADGALEYIDVTEKSGSPELDDAVVQAFRIAGPYPNPPEGLVEKDGRVYLPVMSFEVGLGIAAPQYQGIDPRAGVQFPGILKSPR
jgi:protein TonB